MRWMQEQHGSLCDECKNSITLYMVKAKTARIFLRGELRTAWVFTWWTSACVFNRWLYEQHGSLCKNSIDLYAVILRAAWVFMRWFYKQHRSLCGELTDYKQALTVEKDYVDLQAMTEYLFNVLSRTLKDLKAEEGRIFSGSEFKTPGAWYWKDCARTLTRTTREIFERKNEEIWRVSTRTNSRRGKVVECHQSTGMKKLLLTAFI